MDLTDVFFLLSALLGLLILCVISRRKQVRRAMLASQARGRALVGC